MTRAVCALWALDVWQAFLNNSILVESRDDKGSVCIVSFGCLASFPKQFETKYDVVQMFLETDTYLSGFHFQVPSSSIQDLRSLFERPGRPWSFVGFRTQTILWKFYTVGVLAWRLAWGLMGLICEIFADVLLTSLLVGKKWQGLSCECWETLRTSMDGPSEWIWLKCWNCLQFGEIDAAKVFCCQTFWW